MSVIARYVRWLGHDAEGHLPPVDVLAGILASDTRRIPSAWPPLRSDEALVIVPPQWIGDWESGYPLPPGYQYIWRVAVARLQSLPPQPMHTPYRPPALPASASGPRAQTRWPHRASNAGNRRSRL